MEVVITDRGMTYLQKLQEELDTTKSIPGPQKHHDYLILWYLDKDGPDTVDNLIEKHKFFKDDTEKLRKIIRGLFEGGYIDTY